MRFLGGESLFQKKVKAPILKAEMRIERPEGRW